MLRAPEQSVVPPPAGRNAADAARPHRRLHWASICALVALGAVITAWYVFVPASVPAHVVVDNVFFTVTSGLATLFCLLAASRGAGLPWRLFGLACLAWFAGQLVWNGYQIILHRPPPFPSLADVGYTMFYPLSVASLLWLIRRASPRLELEILLDGLIVSTVTTLLAFEVLFVPSMPTGLQHPMALLVSLAWQIGIVAVVILGGLALLLHAHSSDRWSIGAVLAGFLAFAVADLIYGRVAFEGTYAIGMLIDLGWNLGFLFVGIGAVIAGTQDNAGTRRDQIVDSGRRHAGSVLGMIAFGALAAYAAIDTTGNLTVAIGIIALAILIAARFAYSARQEAHLALRTRERDRLAAEVAARRATQTEMSSALEAQRLANLELEQLNRSKSEFVTVVSHEFRTPLTSIQGFADVLNDEELTEGEVKEFATIIGRNARRLARMIDEMLDLERLESGQIRAKSDLVDLNAVVTHVVESLRAELTGHTIRLDLKPELPHLVGDWDQLTQVVTNLVANAIKYSPDGGEVVVRTGRADHAIHLLVRDDGIGIPADALETIFERFVRATPSGERFQGTGLGLPITRQLVELHGGKVWAERNGGGGSTFHVLLPIAGYAAFNEDTIQSAANELEVARS